MHDTLRVFCVFTLTFALTAGLFGFATPAVAEEVAEEETVEEPLWQSSLGLSYLATSGNSDTSSLGLKLEAARRPAPWGLEAKAFVDRAEENSTVTAERFFAGLRGVRALESGPELFAGVSFEQDEFSGIDLRTLVEAGVSLTAKDTEKDLLRFDLGVTWTDEDRVPPAADFDGLGAILGLRYDRKISENADFSQTLTYFPSFEESDDWRAEAVSALTAALNERLAVQVGYEVRYRNLPVGDRDDTDTSSKVSLVWKL